MYNVWITRQLFPDQNQNLGESGEQTKGPFSLSEIENEKVCYSDYINLNKEALRLFKWDAVVWVELWTWTCFFCCRYLIYSSPNCCVTTSKPSCHVHQTQLFIIPDTQRAQKNQYLIMKQTPHFTSQAEHYDEFITMKNSINVNSWEIWR